MRKILSICVAALGFFVATPGAYAQSADQNNYNYSGNYAGQQYAQEQCCGDVVEQACGTCYCLYCKYEPCYYNEWHTVCEPKVFRKKCCRYVPREYEKCCVKYVPQYYTQTCCRYEPEYFYVDETRDVPRKVCEQKVNYVPRYYYKQVCNQNSSGYYQGADYSQGGCAPACAPACR